MAELPAPPRDPDPEHWCSPERLERLKRELGASASLLTVAGLLPRVVEYWVRRELAEEMARLPAWPAEEREAELDELEQAWHAKHDGAARGLSPVQLRQKLLVAPGCSRWARMQWQQRLETLYLERKAQLDRASCRLLRVADKYLALELYHRIRAGESSFEKLALDYGEGPERLQGGLLALQPLAKLPLGLAPVLQQLQPGELTPPQRLGEGFALVQLEAFVPAPLDTAAENALLSQELNAWMRQLLPLLQAQLTSDSIPQVPSP
jgi:parvulin-like peptidyl-prolyl isomerase